MSPKVNPKKKKWSNSPLKSLVIGLELILIYS